MGKINTGNYRKKNLLLQERKPISKKFKELKKLRQILKVQNIKSLRKTDERKENRGKKKLKRIAKNTILRNKNGNKGKLKEEDG